MSQSTAADGEHLGRSSGQGPPAWVVFLSLLVGEYVLLSQFFDAQDLLIPAQLHANLSEIGSVLPVAFVVVVATIASGGPPVKEALGLLRTSRRAGVASLIFLLLHAALYLGVFLLAREIATGQADVDSSRRLLVVWGLLVPVTSVTAGFVFWERSKIFAAAKAARGGLFVGVVVGLAAWGAGFVARLIETPLAGLTLELVHALLTVLTPDPVASVPDKLVGTERFYITVAPVCSGVEGLGLMLVFASAFLFFRRKVLNFPRALLLLPVSLGAIWLLNVVRLTGLIAVGTWISADIALGGFHSKAGWVLFTLCAWGIVVWAERGLQRDLDSKAGIEGQPTSQQLLPLRETVGERAEAAYLLPLLAVLAVSLVSGLMTTGMDVFYPIRVVVAAALLWKFRRRLFPQRLDFSYRALLVGTALAVVWILGFERSAESASPNLGDELLALPRVGAGAWLAFRGIGSVLTVPVIEELAFRGFLLRRLSGADFESVEYRDCGWFALVVSSLAFGLLHSQWALGCVAGLVFGLMARFENRLGPAIVAHASANLVLFVYAVWFGDWELL